MTLDQYQTWAWGRTVTDVKLAYAAAAGGGGGAWTRMTDMSRT